MSKTLLITYTPRNERSNTKKLVEMFKQEAKNTDVEILDLLQDQPDFFLEQNLSAYYKRNYGKQDLSEQEAASMSKMDRMTAQFKNADFIVLAYPMYNFSVPAIVKAYFDSVMQTGQTFYFGPTGPVGLMQGKKALIISTSAGTYSEATNNLSSEHSVTLATAEFQFMGVSDIQIINAQGLGMDKEKNERTMQEAGEKMKQIIGKWYMGN